MIEQPASPPTEEPAPPSRAGVVRLPFLPPTATYVILGFTVLVYILQQVSVAVFGYAVYEADWLVIYGARINEAIRAGELWRYITPVFLHGSLAHIFFNMYALLTVGSFLERHFGHGRFTLLYFLGAFSGNVFSFLLTGDQGYSIGASTAVFGLIAAEVIFFYQNRKLFGGMARRAISNAGFIIAVNLFIGLAPGIDNWGHVGGLLGGAIFTWFAGPQWMVTGMSTDLRLKDQREIREIIFGTSAVGIIFGALALFKMFWA